MHAVVIVDGLSLEDFDATGGYRHLPSKIGNSEIARLMGSGREFGYGPLMLFLAGVEVHAKKENNALTWMMIYDQEQQAGSSHKQDSAEIKSLFDQKFTEYVTFIGTEPGKVPWRSIIDAICARRCSIASSRGVCKSTSAAIRASISASSVCMIRRPGAASAVRAFTARVSSSRMA